MSNHLKPGHAFFDTIDDIDPKWLRKQELGYFKYLDDDGIWDGKKTGDADLDYFLLKRNEDLLGKDDPRIIEEKLEDLTPVEVIEDKALDTLDEMPGGKTVHSWLSTLY